MPKEVPVFYRSVLLISLLALMSGCANHFTFSQKTALASNKSIFLEPTTQKTVYVEIRNSSNNQKFQLDGITHVIEQKGYTVTETPDDAHFLLQANTVFCQEAPLGMTADTLVAAGWGGAIGAAGGAMAALEGARTSLIPGLGIAGAAIGAGASAISEDTLFLCASDVQLTERTDMIVEQTVTDHQTLGSSQPAQGGSLLGGIFGQSSSRTPTPGHAQETVTETLHGKKRQHITRLVASAQQMWLDLEDANQALAKELTQGIANLLP